MRFAPFVLLLFLLAGCAKEEESGPAQAAPDTAAAVIPSAAAPTGQATPPKQDSPEPTSAASAETAVASAEPAGVSPDPDDDGAVRRIAEFYLTDRLGWRADYYFYGMSREDMVLSKTTDGGDSWTVLADGTKPGGKVPGGEHAGFEFTDEKKGWTIVNTPRDGEIGLYRTNDGGASWELQPVSKPADWDEDEFVYLQSLHYISPTVGAFAATNGSSKFLCLTVDGGDTWTAHAEPDGKIGNASWHFDTYDRGPNVYTLTVGQSSWTF